MTEEIKMYKRLLRLPKYLKRKLMKYKLLFRLRKFIEYPFDLADSIRDVNYELLKWFYEKGQLDLVNWESNKEHKEVYSKMRSSYLWYTQIRPKQNEQYEYYLEKFYGPNNVTVIFNEDSIIKLEYGKYKDKKYFEFLRRLEQHLYNVDQDRLKNIIDIRNHLWT
jgi:hypothetical protein